MPKYQPCTRIIKFLRCAKFHDHYISRFFEFNAHLMIVQKLCAHLLAHQTTIPPCAIPKVHIFWEGHKFLRNLHRRFVQCGNGQIYGGDFAKFCGLLRIYELQSEEPITIGRKYVLKWVLVSSLIKKQYFQLPYFRE